MKITRKYKITFKGYKNLESSVKADVRGTIASQFNMTQAEVEESLEKTEEICIVRQFCCDPLIVEIHHILSPVTNQSDFRIIASCEILGIIVENDESPIIRGTNHTIEKTGEGIQFKPKPKPKFDLSTLKPFDKVVARSCEGATWIATLFSHKGETIIVTTHGAMKQCVPYNEETAYLIGTSKTAPEKYINWLYGRTRIYANNSNPGMYNNIITKPC